MARTHACLRHLLGLSDFDVDSIEVAGDKVRPGSSYYQGFVATRIGCCYRLLWWYSQAMKRNHLLLSPFLAPFDPIRGEMFRSSLLLVKYATMLASATILYHLVRRRLVCVLCGVTLLVGVRTPCQHYAYPPSSV